MTEYQRLLESSDDELELALLRSADFDTPRADWLGHAAVALGVAASGTMLGATAAGAAPAVAVMTGEASAAAALSGPGVGSAAAGSSVAGAVGGTAALGLLKSTLIGAASGIVAMVGLGVATGSFSERPTDLAEGNRVEVPAAVPPASPITPGAVDGVVKTRVPATAGADESGKSALTGPAFEQSTERQGVQGAARLEQQANAPALPTASFPDDASGTSRAIATAPNLVPESSKLAEEVAMLQEARRQLMASDANAALQTLHAYSTRSRSGVLDAEAAILRIQALAKSGQRDRASSEARRFLAQHPNSQHTASLRELLEN